MRGCLNYVQLWTIRIPHWPRSVRTDTLEAGDDFVFSKNSEDRLTGLENGSSEGEVKKPMEKCQRLFYTHKLDQRWTCFLIMSLITFTVPSPQKPMFSCHSVHNKHFYIYCSDNSFLIWGFERTLACASLFARIIFFHALSILPSAQT